MVSVSKRQYIFMQLRLHKNPKPKKSDEYFAWISALPTNSGIFSYGLLFISVLTVFELCRKI
jgi:hypothetical protein